MPTPGVTDSGQQQTRRLICDAQSPPLPLPSASVFKLRGCHLSDVPFEQLTAETRYQAFAARILLGLARQDVLMRSGSRVAL